MNSEHLDPFLCRPLLVPKIWGGDKLYEKFGKPTSQSKIGESWEVADLEEGQSYVASGAHKGKTLGQMVDLYGRDLVGTATALRRFPLLIKLLDANDDLSVQVHPGPESAKLFKKAKSKDECWIILDSENGEIAHGLKAKTTMESLRESIAHNSCEDLLNIISVKQNDAVRVTPGTVHAIKRGVALLEIQEPSDSTFRLYDYGRRGEDGNFRDLHVDEGLEVLNLNSSTSLLTINNLTHETLFDAPNYRVEILNVKNASWSVSKESTQVLVNLGPNNVVLNDIEIAPYETAIIPAIVNSVTISSKGENRIVLAGVQGELAGNLQVS